MENIVYTKDHCSYCTAAKRLLSEQGVQFEERFLTDAAEIAHMKEFYGWRTYPMVILNGQFIGGYDETRALVSSGRLGEVLRKT